jgi:N-acetyl-anhydromuramyl-L-alanine amidase AmpD
MASVTTDVNLHFTCRKQLKQQQGCKPNHTTQDSSHILESDESGIYSSHSLPQCVWEAKSLQKQIAEVNRNKIILSHKAAFHYHNATNVMNL